LGVFDRQLRPDDRAESRLLRGFVKTRSAVDTVGIEECERGIAERRRTLDERFGQRGTLKKAEGRCGVELDVHGNR
jgi:hypothetical protein